MSILGTSVAAGVAQTSLAAQQVARAKDRESVKQREEAKRARDAFETHMQVVEEGDEAETIDRLQIDGQLPEHVPPQLQEDGQRRHGHYQPQGDSANLSSDSSDSPDSAESPESTESTEIGDAASPEDTAVPPQPTGGAKPSYDAAKEAVKPHLDIKA